MPAAILNTPYKTHPISYGPALLYARFTAAAVANNAFLTLGLGVANQFLHVIYMQLRSSVAGEVMVKDSTGFTLASATLAANTWTNIDFGGFGVFTRIAADDIKIRNFTGGAADLGCTIGWAQV